MSHKGSWNRIRDYQAWNNSPLWDKKPTRIIDIIKEYPAETLAYEQGLLKINFENEEGVKVSYVLVGKE